MANHQQQQELQQQAFSNMPLTLKDVESHLQQEMLLYSTMYDQSAQSQVYFDDGLEALLLDQDIGMRSRAYSHDFSVSPIVEAPARYPANLSVGPLPPAPPLYRAKALPSCVPAPIASIQAKELHQDLDKKPAYVSSGALLTQSHLHFASLNGEFPVKY